MHVLTCDTRHGWRSHWALRSWNMSGYSLRSDDGLPMENVCYGKSWKDQGFLSKPIFYKTKLETLDRSHYAVLMDSDTFWAVDSLETFWHKFDCTRNGKEVVLSTEMQCWVGRYCTDDDLKRWYSDLKDTPSFSPFANSGVIVGKVGSLIDMLDYVIKNNKDYFVEKHGGKMKFDDQYAIADYAITIAPQVVALDYFQQLSSSFSIHAESDPEDPKRWGFVCKRLNGSISHHCPDYTPRMARQQFFKIDKDTCLASRQTMNPKISLSQFVNTLAPDPAIWHGNGVGKMVYASVMQMVFDCNVKKHLNMTTEEYREFPSAW